jgi:hypothetical protein
VKPARHHNSTRHTSRAFFAFAVHSFTITKLMTPLPEAHLFSQPFHLTAKAHKAQKVFTDSLTLSR